ncbi:MAG: TrmH family RNA methyltransferase [Aureliella sp.]
MIERLTDLDDPRLVPFRGMRTANWTAASGWFIAEGPRLVERLLKSSFAVHSLLISEKYLDEWQGRIPAGTQAIVVPEELISQLLGFNFHRGVIACGLRKEPLALRQSLAQPLDRSATLVAVHGVQDPENLGGILRSCAALGIEHILVGPKSADPLCRRVLRVSMGTVLSLKLYQSPDLQSDLDWLRAEHGAQTVATTLGEGSEPLEQASRNTPLVIMLGNEAHGLPPELQQAADRRVRIDMRLGTDSLNVSVAAGIILHYFCRVAR